jgi:hypothetical protein
MMRNRSKLAVALLATGCITLWSVNLSNRAWSATKTENFDVDPGWNSNNNTGFGSNNYGFSNTDFAGGTPGEAGGAVSSRTEVTTWYADTNLGGSFSPQLSLMASGRLTVDSVEPGFDGGFDIGFFDNLSTTLSDRGGIEEALVFSILEQSSTTYRVRVRFGNVASDATSSHVLDAGTDYLFDLRYDPSGGGMDVGRLVAEFRLAADDSLIVTQTVDNSSTLTYDLNSFGFATLDFDVNNPAANVFIDDLAYGEPTTTETPGDYDGDGIVGASDYAVFRDTLGSTSDLRADGNGSNMIDHGDFQTWSANFGNSSGPQAGAASIPEPAGLSLALVACLATHVLIRRWTPM